MKIFFVTNLPSPYRVDFFNELGKYYDLTVGYERKRASDRDKRWVGDVALNFKEEYLKLQQYRSSSSKGDAIVKYIKNNKFDIIIFSGYSSPSVIRAILYCQRHKIRYFVEYDGGFNKPEPFYKRLIKKHLISRAYGHFITCEELKKYLLSLKIPEGRIHMYPFSSLKNEDILESLPSPEEKKQLKINLGIPEDRIIIAVGQFIHRKGFDVLLNALRTVDSSVGVYIIGGTPTEEYIAMKKDYMLDNVHYIDFMSKKELKKWYCAADLFVFPTREDIWGLVINEAMACGLSVISTNRCIAATELIRDDFNGYVVAVDNPDELAEKINHVISDDKMLAEMGERSLHRIRSYTIENMVQKHVEVLQSIKLDSCDFAKN